MTDHAAADAAATAAFKALRARARAEHGSNTQPLLVVYAGESFLRRLAMSGHAQRMVLKGGMLMAASDIRRMTKDADLATHGMARHSKIAGAVQIRQGVGATPRSLRSIGWTALVRPAKFEEALMLERPTQIGYERGRFDRFAEIFASLVGRAAFFTVAIILVVLWIPLIVVFESVDTWQLVLNTVTSVVAFLLIALLQNTERQHRRAARRGEARGAHLTPDAGWATGRAAAGHPLVGRLVEMGHTTRRRRARR